MATVTPMNAMLGATVEGIDLARPLDDDAFATVLRALGDYGVLRFPDQWPDAAALKRFAARFGTLEINVANWFQEPGHPEVMILSNIVRDGKPIGVRDAGQDWHTDMSYSDPIALANVLHAVTVPVRDGRALGATRFANMHAAYRDLPPEVKSILATATATHDFDNFWDRMRRRPGSPRAPLTEEQREAKPPVSHPVFLRHPITGHNVLYANPGYTVRIDTLPEDESDAMLAYLFDHQLQPKYQYEHVWTEGDVLMCDNIGTLHYAQPDYGPDEHRMLRRCQVIADRVFDPAFVTSALGAHA